MSKYTLIYSHHAHKDAKKIASSGLQSKVDQILKLLTENPFESYPPFEKLHGELSHAYSRRINIEHRIEYTVDDETKEVNLLRMWTHYE